MGKKNKQKRPHDAPPAPPPQDAGGIVRSAELEVGSATPELPTPNSELPRSRLRRLLPDIIKVFLALLVIGLAIAVWLKPPLIQSASPYVSYTFGGQTFTNAVLYRPLSVPTRFYVGLPEMLGGHYQWFTVDRRREIAALADGPPGHTFLGWPAVRRNAPLGLDLEFRMLDGSEWQVSFLPDQIVFSNAILSVRLDTQKQETK